MALVKSERLFAQRLQNVEESSTMQVMIAAQKLKAQGVQVVDLGAGEPDFNTPDNIKEAAKRAIDANFTRYTVVAGLPEVREAICARYRADYDISVTPAEVLLTVGGKQALFNTALALFNPGDEVITHAPYWPTIPEQVKLVGATPVIVQTDWRDAFPGVNAVTLMELAEPPDPRRARLLPVVAFAVDRRIESGHADYWDYAARIELAVLTFDEAKAVQARSRAVALIRESWEPESTARNLRLIREARARRGEYVTWALTIEQELEKRAEQ